MLLPSLPEQRGEGYFIGFYHLILLFVELLIFIWDFFKPRLNVLFNANEFYIPLSYSFKITSYEKRGGNQYITTTAMITQEVS